MRPKTIRVEGFSAYRAPVEVQLGGVEFFSLSGATGSGKSSLVDAMIFALYGRVPRLGARAVEPVISAGADQARVAFDFEVGGTDYTAARLAQRTKSGATVREARLQKGSKVIADGASDVTAAVEELLRLRFEDFTRTVVLPQGEFARFLTADKAERQALLRSLLGLDVYKAVRELALRRKDVADERVRSATARLENLTVPEADELKTAKRHLEALETLDGGIVEQEKKLAGLDSAAVAAEDFTAVVHGRIERLRAIASPHRLEELDSLAVAAREALSEAEEAVDPAAAETARLEEAIAALPSLDALRAIRDSRRRFSDLEVRLATIDVAEARTAAEKASEVLAEAKRRASRARSALEEERAAHAAHALTLNLEAGGTCPVCHQDVARPPEAEAPAGLVELEESEAAAAAAVEEASSAASSADSALAALATASSEVEGQMTDLTTELADAPSVEELLTIEQSHQELSEELAASKKRLEQTMAEHRQSEKRLEDLSEAIRSVGRDLMAARQVVADLDPPLPASDDPIVQWKELLEWRDGSVAEVNKALEEAVEKAAAARDQSARFRSQVVADLEAAGVEAVEPYAVGVTRELEVTRSFVSEAEKALAETKELEESVEASRREGAVAGALAQHLKADGFERWLMAGAIADLVAGANGRLEQLSNGSYSLYSDETGGFSIIDHHNADEIRSVATLSGGETFLVSLALALSLAETLAARGGADLDAIVIDEGFGTLDDESLDTVASVLEDLAGNLMVGVITHVKELAARAPVRYEVTREPGGSKVRQVVA